MATKELLDKVYATSPPDSVPSDVKFQLLDKLDENKLRSFMFVDNVIAGRHIYSASRRTERIGAFVRDSADASKLLRSMQYFGLIIPIEFYPEHYAPWIGTQYSDTSSLKASNKYCEAYWSYRVTIDWDRIKWS